MGRMADDAVPVLGCAVRIPFRDDVLMAIITNLGHRTLLDLGLLSLFYVSRALQGQTGVFPNP